RRQITANDVLLTPELGSLGFTDFQNARQAISAGEAAATAALPRLKRYALPPDEYAAYRSAHAQPLPPPVRITRIEIKTSGGVPKRVVSDALHVKPGDLYDPQSVSQDLLGLTTGGNFESVTQQVVSHGNDNVLEINAREKYWGPNFLLFGLGMSSSSTDEGGFRLHVGYRRPWLTESGLEFRADTTIGSDLQSARVELRQPLPMAYGVYVAPYAEYQRRYANLYDNTGDVKVTQYLMQTARAGLDLGLPIARLGDFRIGLGYVTGHGSPTYNLPFDDGSGQALLWPSFTSRALTARARLVIDQLDDPMFPRKGYFTELRVERSLVSRNGGSAQEFDDGINDAPYTEIYGKAMIAQQFGRHSVSATIEGGKSIGGTNLINAFNFTLGGFQHLSAYAADQLNGNELAYGQITYMNQLMTFNASPVKALSVGASAEVGNVWSSGQQIGGGALKQSYTFFTSLSTAFGPVYIGVALAPGGRRNFYLQLGRTY
ncbi:patatin, partial [Burkholderia pyrrocinia]